MHTEAERFWKKVDKTSPEGCWLWTASVNGWGYGRFRVGGPRTGTVPRELMSHRYAYEKLVGPVPADRPTLDHLCRNRRCVNPAHLEPVTPGENLKRGIGAPGLNARKTYCPMGHEYTPENTLTDRKGWRRCRTCHGVWKSSPEQLAHRRELRRLHNPAVQARGPYRRRT